MNLKGLNPTESAWYQYLHTQTVARDTVVDEKRRNVTLTYPGIPYWSFELHPRIPDLMSILRVVEDSVMYGVVQSQPTRPGESLNLYREMREAQVPGFVTSLELTISKSMYDPTVPKWPLKVKVGHGYRSGPRVTDGTIVKVPGKDEPLVIRKMGYTHVDGKTRKVAGSLPRWYTDALDGNEMWDQVLKVERLKTRPLETYTRPYMVLCSDTDHFNHVNYAVYIRECLDTLRQAVTEKEFSRPISANHTSEKQKPVYPTRMASAIMRQGVKTLRARYVKETLVGENLCAHMWEEHDKPFWVFFIIESRNHPSGDDIRFEMSLEYFAPVSRL